MTKYPFRSFDSSLALQTASVTSIHAVGTTANIGLAIWRGETTVEGVQDMARALEDLHVSYPRIGLIQVVERNAPPPSATSRKAIAELLAGMSDSLASSALVFEETGFKMAAVRAIVSGITAIARPPYPHIIFSMAESAADWTCKMASSRALTLESDVILEALQSLRQELDRRSGTQVISWRAPLVD